MTTFKSDARRLARQLKPLPFLDRHKLARVAARDLDDARRLLPLLGGDVQTFQTFNGASREFHTVATFKGQRLEPLCTFLEDFCPWTDDSHAKFTPLTDDSDLP